MGRISGTTAAAAAIAVLLATQAAGAAPRAQHAAAPAQHAIPALSSLPGTALPQLRSSQLIGHVAAGQRMSTVVYLRPQNSWLLHQVAMRTTARRPYPRSVLERLFMPSASTIASVESYLRSQGLTVTSRHLLAIETSGTAAANEHAFGVSLGLYRGANGRVFQAPSGPTRLPRALAPAVQAVGGLDTALRLLPQDSPPTAPSTVSATCAGALNTKSFFPSAMLPADLAGATGYNHNVLINAGDDGTGETIGLVEFSNYKSADITSTFRNCFPAISAPNPVNVNIDSGTTDLSGAGEVELDIEAAQAAAPDAHVRVYMAPNNVSLTADIIDQMVSDTVTVASDSWGLCEPVLPPALLANENTSLELAAAAGLTLYVASGDDGSSGCKRVTGSNSLFTDDPSSQPFATSVGGTKLTTSPSYHETAWKFGGGGTSFWWPKPQWQVGKTVTIPGGGNKCGYPTGQCRQTPDVALDANPSTGYIVFCTAGTIKCGGATGWYVIGGTSGAAPLMAGITADANEYSLGHTGSRLGFASPFLYANAGTSVFHDITVGNNNIFGGTSYQAGPGYDLATGLGSVDANNFATALAAASPNPPNPDSTSLTALGPTDNKSVSYGTALTFHGVLTDTQGGSTPIANAPVYLITSFGTFFDETDGSGNWSITLARAMVRNSAWHAAFIGSDVNDPAVSPTLHVKIFPHLTSVVALPFSNGHYNGTHNVFFTFHGQSSPNMHGAHVIAQFRVGSGAWTGIVGVVVGKKGAYTIRLKNTKPLTFQLRWFFPGGTNWLSAASPPRLVKLS